MIGYFTPTQQGTGDEFVEEVARRFEQLGARVAGAVQLNSTSSKSKRAKMVLEILGSNKVIGISQSLGPFASGCALDPEGLENAAQIVLESLDEDRDLLILNKFGKQERDGQGFRDVLVKALDLDVPVLLGVSANLEAEFRGFAGDFAIKLEPELECILEWYRSAKPS